MKRISTLCFIVFLAAVLGCADLTASQKLLLYLSVRASAQQLCREKSTDCQPGSKIWFGDSNSCMMDLPSNVCNAGVSGYTAYDVENAYAEYMTVEHSELFVMIGTNNLLRGQTVDNFLVSYRSMINHLAEFRIPIHCVAILPSIYDQHNERVVEANAEIQSLCVEMGLTYIETTGYTAADFRPDGIHLNDAGREKFYAQIQPWLE